MVIFIYFFSALNLLFFGPLDLVHGNSSQRISYTGAGRRDSIDDRAAAYRTFAKKAPGSILGQE